MPSASCGSTAAEWDSRQSVRRGIVEVDPYLPSQTLEGTRPLCTTPHLELLDASFQPNPKHRTWRVGVNMVTENLTGTFRIFVSYSRRDSAAADTIVAALEARGFEVMIDRRDLPFGEEWQKELAEFIRISDTVIWLVSKHSVLSEWVNWELDEVKARSKRLVPVMVGLTAAARLPRQLGAIHILPADRVFELSRDLGTLVGVIETDRAWLKQGSRLHDRAAEWLTKGRSPGLLLSRAALTDAERWKDAQPIKAPPPSEEIVELIIASQRSATKRQRRWIAFSMAIAIGALSLSALAIWQWTIATHYAEVSQQGVDEMVFNIARTLRDERGMSNSATDKMLSTAERVVDKMAASAWDPTWQHRKVAILTEFADVFEARGNRDRQMEFARKAFDNAASLASRYPQETGYRRAQWVAYGKVADALEKTGDILESLNYWQRALPIARALSTEDPSNVRWQRDLAVSHSRIGGMELRLGKHAEALANFVTCLSIRDRLARDDSSNLDLQREVALCHGNVGDVLVVIGKTEDAIASYEAEIAITRRRAQLLPDNIDAQYRLSVSLDRLGGLYQRQNKKELSEKYFEQCRVIRGSISQENSYDVEWRRPCGAF